MLVSRNFASCLRLKRELFTKVFFEPPAFPTLLRAAFYTCDVSRLPLIGGLAPSHLIKISQSKNAPPRWNIKLSGGTLARTLTNKPCKLTSYFSQASKSLYLDKNLHTMSTMPTDKFAINDSSDYNPLISISYPRLNCLN